MNTSKQLLTLLAQHNISLIHDIRPEHRECIIKATQNVSTPLAIFDGDIVTIEDGHIMCVERIIVSPDYATRPCRPETIKAYCILMNAAKDCPEIAENINWETVMYRTEDIIRKQYIAFCKITPVYIYFPEANIKFPHIGL